MFVVSEESAICFLHWYRRAAAMIIAPAKHHRLLTPMSWNVPLRIIQRQQILGAAVVRKGEIEIPALTPFIRIPEARSAQGYMRHVLTT